MDDRIVQYCLANYLEFNNGDRELLSCNNLERYEAEEETEPEKIVLDSFEKIISHLCMGLDVRLNHRVDSIDYTGDKVVVICGGTVFEAKKVLVTVPLGVLKFGSLKFTPELPPAKQEAISCMGMNCVNKFLLVFEQAFWDNR